MQNPWFVAIFPGTSSLVAQLLPCDGEPARMGDGPLLQHWGDCDQDEFRSVFNPGGQAIVVGHCFATKQELDQALACTLHTGQPDAFTRLPGSFTTLILDSEKLTVISDLAGQFPVYYYTVNGQTVVTSRPQELNFHLEPDKIRIAASIISPHAIDLVRNRSCFNKIKCLAPASILEIVHGAEPRVRLHEQFEFNPIKSLNEAAQELGSALSNAVASRAVLGLPVSADFSGGMDSTSLAFLAARHISSDEMPVFTSTCPDVASGDSVYAERYAKLDNRLDWHLILDDLPHGLQLLNVPWVEDINISAPLLWMRTRSYFQRVREHGGQLHLVGQGGDDLLDPGAICMFDLLQRRKFAQFLGYGVVQARLGGQSPATVWWRGYRLIKKDLTKKINQLAERIDYSYSEGYRSQFSMNNPFALWSLSISAIDMLTPTIRHQLAELIRSQTLEYSESIERVGVVNFRTLNNLRLNALLMAALRRQVADLDVRLHAPFLDADVIKACLSTPSYQRSHPHEFKILLRKALEGAVPAAVLSRQSKGNYSGMFYRLIRTELPAIRELFRTSYLADLGVIEPSRVDSMLDQFNVRPDFPAWSLESVITAELWLRGLASL